MRKSKTKKIVDVIDDSDAHQIEVDKVFIEFYKKETGRKHVTRRGLSNFINNLLKIYHR